MEDAELDVGYNKERSSDAVEPACVNWGSIPAEIKDWKLKKFYGDEEYASHLMPKLPGAVAVVWLQCSKW